MKTSILIALLTISSIFTQDIPKIIHLNDGSQMSGIIIEESPGEYLKLFNGTSIQQINLVDVKLISSINHYTLQTAEDAHPITQTFADQGKKDISNKTWSITMGSNFGNSFTIKKEIKISQNSATHISFGFPYGIGIGFSAESKYNQNGTKFSTLIGRNVVNEKHEIASSLAYQWRMGSSNSFLSLGLMLSNGSEYIQPVFSFDVRM